MNDKPYWPNQSIYFLTGTTFLHYPYFQEFTQKQIVLHQIQKVKKLIQDTKDELIYSISINHYHLKFYLEDGAMLAKVKQLMHGGTSFEYKKVYPVKHKEFWQDSKVLLVTSDEMDWNVTGYIIGNLLKHKEVNNFDELKECPFSSFKTLLKKYDEEYLKEWVYGVIDVDEDSDGNLDMVQLTRMKRD